MKKLIVLTLALFVLPLQGFASQSMKLDQVLCQGYLDPVSLLRGIVESRHPKVIWAGQLSGLGVPPETVGSRVQDVASKSLVPLYVLAGVIVGVKLWAISQGLPSDQALVLVPGFNKLIGLGATVLSLNVARQVYSAVKTPLPPSRLEDINSPTLEQLAGDKDFESNPYTVWNRYTDPSRPRRGFLVKEINQQLLGLEDLGRGFTQILPELNRPPVPAFLVSETAFYPLPEVMADAMFSQLPEYHRKKNTELLNELLSLENRLAELKRLQKRYSDQLYEMGQDLVRAEGIVPLEISLDFNSGRDALKQVDELIQVWKVALSEAKKKVGAALSQPAPHRSDGNPLSVQN